MKTSRQILANFRGIIDSTLREGFQFSKANFSLAEQKKIFSFLLGIGVDYVEVGNPAKLEVRDMIVGLVAARNGGRTRILSHVRNHEQDVLKAIECGVDGVNILCTVDGERLAAMSRTPAEYRDVLVRNIGAAKARGLEIRVGVEDFFGQAPDKSLEIYGLADAQGVDRIAIADTRGRALSWEVARRIRGLRRRIRASIEVHFHNDLGHAVSNAVAALQAGASFVSTSLLGIGERTGITPLSSLLVNLYMLNPGMGARYDLSLLTEAETYISEICGIEMPPHLMTNPTNGFAHKAGIHLDAMFKFGPQKYEPLSPGLIGNKRTLILNSLISGKRQPAEVRAFMEKYS